MDNNNWHRIIALVDMNAFFASVEQLDFPALRGKPVVVTNGAKGTCIITSSYEARAFGIKTGMRLYEAKTYCPDLIVCPSRPKRYAQISCRIMASLTSITPDIEVFSIDEAFLDLTHCKQLYSSVIEIGEKIKAIVHDTSALFCSVGISGDKSTAKYAAKVKKPNGLTIIPPDQAAKILSGVPVSELCGIGKGITHFLARHGVHVCGDMKKLPIGVLAGRFGNVGRRIWLMCQGLDFEPVHTDVAAAKSMGHGKVMPPNTTDSELVKVYLLHMCEKLAERLRKNKLEAQRFFIGVKASVSYLWLGDKVLLSEPTQSAQLIFQLGIKILASYWSGEPLLQIQVTALDPKPVGLQMDLFGGEANENKPLQGAVDQINSRYGNLTVMPARLLSRSKMHDVIAPAWQPKGHRKSVE